MQNKQCRVREVVAKMLRATAHDYTLTPTPQNAHKLESDVTAFHKSKLIEALQKLAYARDDESKFIDTISALGDSPEVAASWVRENVTRRQKQGECRRAACLESLSHSRV